MTHLQSAARPAADAQNTEPIIQKPQNSGEEKGDQWQVCFGAIDKAQRMPPETIEQFVTDAKDDGEPQDRSPDDDARARRRACFFLVKLVEYRRIAFFADVFAKFMFHEEPVPKRRHDKRDDERDGGEQNDPDSFGENHK